MCVRDDGRVRFHLHDFSALVLQIPPAQPDFFSNQNIISVKPVCFLIKHIQQLYIVMGCQYKLLLVLLMATLVFVGSSSAAPTLGCSRFCTESELKITIPSKYQPHTPFKRSNKQDVAFSANAAALPVTQQNNTDIASSVDGNVAHTPSSWRTWLPTLGTILDSTVHVIIMILGVLNISINPGVHGEQHEVRSLGRCVSYTSR